MTWPSPGLVEEIARKIDEIDWPPTKYADPELIPTARKMVISISNLPDRTSSGLR